MPSWEIAAVIIIILLVVLLTYPTRTFSVSLNWGKWFSKTTPPAASTTAATPAAAAPAATTPSPVGGQATGSLGTSTPSLPNVTVVTLGNGSSSTGSSGSSAGGNGDNIEVTQADNQGSIDAREDQSRNEVIDPGSGAEIDIAPQGLNNQGTGEGTNMPTDRDAITSAFAQLSGITGPMQFWSRKLFRAFSSKRTRKFVDPGTFGRVVDLTPMMTPAQLAVVAYNARLMQPGDQINLYTLAPIDDLLPSGTEGGSSLSRIMILQYVFVRTAKGWALLGSTSDVVPAGTPTASPSILQPSLSRNRSTSMSVQGTAPVVINPTPPPPAANQTSYITDSGTVGGIAVGPTAVWDVFPYYEMGIAKKADLQSCPYSGDVCGELARFITDGQTGTISMSDGSRYSFDGRIVRQLSF